MSFAHILQIHMCISLYRDYDVCDRGAVGVRLILNLAVCTADKADSGQSAQQGALVGDCCCVPMALVWILVL